jgi:hypothetical protein
LLTFYFGGFFLGSVPTTIQGFREKKRGARGGVVTCTKDFFFGPKVAMGPTKKKKRKEKKEELKLPYLDHTFLACCQYIVD